MAIEAIEAADYRRIIGQFATGVAVVTTANDGLLHGMTANAITSVSLDPPLLLVCIDKAAHSHDQFTQSGRFTVNILAEDQQEVSKIFAATSEPEQGRLQGVAFHLGANGVPLIEGCLAYIECAVADQFEGGDHTIFTGSVEDATVAGEAAPLLFYQGKYRRLAD
ncbi:MAG: flavin reductase family protein [Chloroflexi bacterium]|nr:flavin reductase family protein [Chloroflexota bacterium]